MAPLCVGKNHTGTFYSDTWPLRWSLMRDAIAAGAGGYSLRFRAHTRTFERASLSAPAAMSTPTQSAWPLREARCRAVNPSCRRTEQHESMCVRRRGGGEDPLKIHSCQTAAARCHAGRGGAEAHPVRQFETSNHVGQGTEAVDVPFPRGCVERAIALLRKPERANPRRFIGQLPGVAWCRAESPGQRWRQR